MKLIVGNLKMYIEGSNLKEYTNKIKKVENENVVVCPTSIHIPFFIKNKYKVGIQNISTEEIGAFTGEVSASQAKKLGVDYVIIGHSERRQKLNETDLDINKKIKNALASKIKVILCIGETLEEHQLLKTESVLKREIQKDLNQIDENVIIAYEPIWAIGTGVIPTNKEIERTVEYIKLLVHEKTKKTPKVLYGGSVNEKNINELEKIPNIDGYLIGGASSKIDEFLKIIEIVK